MVSEEATSPAQQLKRLQYDLARYKELLNTMKTKYPDDEILPLFYEGKIRELENQIGEFSHEGMYEENQYTDQDIDDFLDDKNTCADCQGSGEEVCMMCHGKGVDQGGDDCVLCGGTGVDDCRTCSGDGFIRSGDHESYEEDGYVCKTCGGNGILLTEDGAKTCPKCNGEGTTKHEDNDDKCPYCQETFPIYQELEKHVVKYHPDEFERDIKGEEDFFEICPKCSTPFYNEGAYNRHMDIHGGDIPHDIAKTKAPKSRSDRERTKPNFEEVYKPQYRCFMCNNIMKGDKCGPCGKIEEECPCKSIAYAEEKEKHNFVKVYPFPYCGECGEDRGNDVHNTEYHVYSEEDEKCPKCGGRMYDQYNDYSFVTECRDCGYKNYHKDEEIAVGFHYCDLHKKNWDDHNQEEADEDKTMGEESTTEQICPDCGKPVRHLARHRREYHEEDDWSKPHRWMAGGPNSDEIECWGCGKDIEDPIHDVSDKNEDMSQSITESVTMGPETLLDTMSMDTPTSKPYVDDTAETGGEKTQDKLLLLCPHGANRLECPQCSKIDTNLDDTTDEWSSGTNKGRM